MDNDDFMPGGHFPAEVYFEMAKQRQAKAEPAEATLAGPQAPKTETQDDPIDEIMTRIYRRFKEWSNRKFSADDVTWCEVRADVLEIIRVTRLEGKRA